jgi:hypothetical protein
MLWILPALGSAAGNLGFGNNPSGIADPVTQRLAIALCSTLGRVA